VTPILFECEESEDFDIRINTNGSRVEYGKSEPFTNVNQTHLIVVRDLLNPNGVEFFEYKTPPLETTALQSRHWQTTGMRSHYLFACIFAGQVSKI
jgi:hypothetical protein